MANLVLRKSGESSAPGPKETLGETFRYWRSRSGAPDQEINLRNEIVGRNLAKALFEDSYNFFEMFLDDSGVSTETQRCFKTLVFDELVKEQSLGDMTALARVITAAMGKFFAPAELIEVVQALEITYQKQVIEQYPPGLPLQVPDIDAVDKLPQLVLGILGVGDL